MRRYSPYLIAIFGFAALDARATSLTDLLSRVPPPPTDVATALASWKDGKVSTPAYAQFKAALEAERAAVATLNGGTPPVLGNSVAPVPGEAPEVQGAIMALNSYLTANSGKAEPAAALKKRTRWISAAMGGNLKSIVDKMAPCPKPCTDPAIIARNQPAMEEKRRQAEQEIKLWDSLFVDWQKSRSGYVANGQGAIAATGDGAKALTPAGKAAIAQYRAAMLNEIETTLSITELAIKRADVIENGDLDAISGSTKSKK